MLYCVGAADASIHGTVININLHENDTWLQFRITEQEAGELPLISLEATDPEFRHFLFLAIRAYLSANERKKIWARGSMLLGTLDAIIVPVLDETAALSNIKKIHQFMDELQHRISRKVNNVSPALLSSVADVLDLSAIEAELQQTDERIDAVVFQLYEIESKEDIQFIQDTLR